MIQDFSNKQIEVIKDSIENNLLSLAQDYLFQYSNLVEESLPDCEGAYKTRKVWTDEDMQKAIEISKEVLIEIINKGEFSF